MIIKNTTILNFKDLSVKKDVDVLIEGNRIKTSSLQEKYYQSIFLANTCKRRLLTNSSYC